MQLPVPFVKLPLKFDVMRLKEEVLQFSEDDWCAHPQGFAGNSALILISHNGNDNDDLAGVMAPTLRLDQCPYIKQIFGSFNTVLGRSRLMRLAPGAEVESHSDIAYYWRDHVRIHIPIVTDPDVRFVCDGMEINMAAGEAWIFDNWRPHYVLNHTDITRIHLVIDTVGSAAFWHLVSQGEIISPKHRGTPASTIRTVEFTAPANDLPIRYEAYNSHQIAGPDTVKAIVQEFIGDLRQSPNTSQEQQILESVLTDMVHEWRAIWSLHGIERTSYPLYGAVLTGALQRVAQSCANVRLPSNGTQALAVLRNYLTACFNPHAEILSRLPIPRFEKPIIIVAAPRSGSSLLFETLAQHPDLWSLGDESHGEIENISGLSPRDRNFHSNVLEARDAAPDISSRLKRVFAERLRRYNEESYAFLPSGQHPGSIRLLEKTPKNALRISFLNALFPDALFVYLHRKPESNLASMMEAWKSGRFITYRDLPDWHGLPWSLLLTPGWHDLPQDDLASIVASQWRQANESIVNGLSNLPTHRWRMLAYEDFINAPGKNLARLWQFCDLPHDAQLISGLDNGLPLSRYTLSPPSTDKWRQHTDDINRVMPNLTSTIDRIQSLGNAL